MMKDLPRNEVTNIGIAVVLEEASAEAKSWSVYIINMKDQVLNNVLVSSRGFGRFHEEQVNTSVLRHSLGTIDAGDYSLIEPIQEELFALTNEYLLSFYISDVLYDKRYVFVPESVVETNFIRIPILKKPGVMIV